MTLRRNCRNPPWRRLRIPFALNQVCRRADQRITETAGLILSVRDLLAPTRVTVKAKHAPLLALQAFRDGRFGFAALEPYHRIWQGLLDFSQHRLWPMATR